MRIDTALFRLRLFKSRALAQQCIATGHLRCNGVRVERPSHAVAAGDVLTVPLGNRIRVLAIEALPHRRGPAVESRQCYRELDPGGESAIAPGRGRARKGTPPQ